MSNGYDFDSTANVYRDAVHHYAAHLSEGWDVANDYCGRECIADGSTGEADMLARVMTNLTSDERDAVLDAMDADAAPDFSSMDAEEIDEWVAAITDETLVHFDGGDAYRSTCEFLTDDERGVADEFLSLEFEGSHLCAALALGGPNAILTRDFDGDKLTVSWASDKREFRGEEVASVLDYLSEYAA